MRNDGNFAVKSKFMIAAEHPKKPAGVVAATVSRICFQRQGLLDLKASVTQRSTVPSPSGSSELARRTMLMRSSHIAAAPAGLAGSVSHHIADISLGPGSNGTAW